MTEEVAPRIDEKPATYRKKMQVWLMIAFGSVLLLLLALTVINIFTKMGGKPQVKTAPKEQAVKTSDRQDQFDQLVNNRRIRSADAGPEADPATALEQSFNRLAEGGREAGDSQDPAVPQLSAAEKAVRQWEQRERLRALDSAKTSWGMKTAAKGGLGQAGAAAPGAAARVSNPAITNSDELMTRLDALNEPFEESGSIEQRRAEVRKRIDEAQKLRAALAAQGASALQAGGNLVADQEPVKRELQQVSSGFNSAPDNVVGYTKSNKYNADIAGKLKVPPGTVIPTTLMRKAISDYMTGSLQAIVSHDVYDTTRQFVLFPKGTEINIGVTRTRNVNEAISNRVAFLVKEGVLPNGNKIDFTKASSVDREGVGAIEDQVDYHFMAQFLGVAAYALVSGGSSYSGTGDEEGSYAGDVGENARREFSPLVQKYLNIVPTVTIRPGQSFRVIIEEEMYVEPWSDLYAKYVD
jgi:type IV secretory pathway VirB10-like protein